jgi:mannose-6-phosphate isomerase-like protein (cupin superfamily)
MGSPYTKKRLTDVEDSAPRFGLGEVQQARFANADLEVEQAGLAYHRLAPGKRQAFGHKHDRAEEIYVVLSGTGRVKLDEEIVEVEALDAVRVGPGVIRAFEAGADGLEYLAVGALADRDDFELLNDWWDD